MKSVQLVGWGHEGTLGSLQKGGAGAVGTELCLLSVKTWGSCCSQEPKEG
jgi:hypothetical protein